jgi:hypothetical protein
MSQSTQITLSQTPEGRIILHLYSLLRDKKLRWHMKGIVRDLTCIVNN